MEKWPTPLSLCLIGRIYRFTHHVVMHMLCSGTNVFLVLILVQPQELDCFGFD